MKDNITKIQKLLTDNKCLLDLTYDYCLSVADKSVEAINISCVLDILRLNFEKIYNQTEEIAQDYLK